MEKRNINWLKSVRMSKIKDLIYGKMKMFLFLLLPLLAALIACNGEPPLTNTQTPEEVLQMYQNFVDKNYFDKARSLCTATEKERLNDLEAILEKELQDSTILTTVFLKIDCQTKGKITRCDCLVKDEYEQYQAEYKLVKKGGVWLVDSPDEEIIIESDVIQNTLEEMKE